MENQEALERATIRAEAKIGFLKSLGVYVIVNVALVIINLIISPEHYWFYWTTIFWGIGLALYGRKVFFKTSRMRDRMVQKEMEREAKKS